MNKKIFGLIVVGMLIAAFVFNLSSFEITARNAVDDCPLHNVRCPQLIRPIGAEPELFVVGEAIGDYCPTDKALGCYSRDMNVIILAEEDKGVIAHERCHWLCGNEHIEDTVEIPLKDKFKATRSK